jgi:predicted secreted protein
LNPIANQLDVPQFHRFCRALIGDYVDLLEMLAREGTRLCIVGVAGSPSCGIITTSSGYTGGRVRECEHTHVSGRGVFMEELLAELERRGVEARVEEIGADGRPKRMDEKEFGSLPGMKSFQREEIDRFD